MDLKRYIVDVPDFPKPGIVFKDITPLLGDEGAFRYAVNQMCNPYREAGIQKVAAPESRGFIFGAAMALELGAGFVPVRKRGKLPRKTMSVEYDLEYGKDIVEMHKDGIYPWEKVLLVDDVLATGGTAEGMGKLVEGSGGEIAGFCFLIELEFLNGRKRLEGREVYSLIRY